MSVAGHFGLWLLGLAEPETQTTEAERECLARHAQGKLRLAEIGVWHGVTTLCLREAMQYSAVLYAIDPFEPGRLGFSIPRTIAHRNVRKCSNGSVEWLRCTGLEAAKRVIASGGEPIDLLFVDGDHSYAGLRDDWLSWSPLMKVTGIVALHDSRSCRSRRIEDAGSVRYTREVIMRDPAFELIEVVDTLTVLTRLQ